MSAKNCVCAGAVDAEMDDWIALGGSNSGCCGNNRHTYGFHVPAALLPIKDYSRRHEAPPPADMSWACAGDFHHGGSPTLRGMHSAVLGRLIRGELPMICEYIGKPFPGEPVLYWARWDGVTTVKKYTGAGHDMWSHISWWRSRAGERANLWRPAAMTPVSVLKPGQLATDGRLGPATIRRWQQILGTPTDGVISTPRSALVSAVQQSLNTHGARLRVDGAGIAQDGRRYATTAALQKYLGTPVDGRLSTPRSMTVQALQRHLNAGTWH